MVRTFCGCLLATVLIVPQCASAGYWESTVVFADSALAAFNTCYATLGNTNPNGGALIRIDLTTGAGTLIGATGITGSLGDKGVPALAIRSNGEMYAVDIGPSANLYQISAKTGAATLVGNTGLPSPTAMVFDGYGVLNAVAANGDLHTLNVTTGAATLVGATGVGLKGLAVNPADGWLWGSDASSRIYRIDGQTAVATLIGNTGLAPSPDLCFDETGVLYAVSGGGLSPNNLITINPLTGAGTVIGSIGFLAVSGMAIRLDQIVPTLVQGYSSRWLGRHVELRWRLSEPGAGIDFTIDRAVATGDYRRMEGASVSWDGAEYLFLDAAVEPGRTYRYRVAVLEDGTLVTSFETSVTVPAIEAALGQNHPNPFRASTRIDYVTGKPSHVTLAVHDVAGRLVRTLVDRPMDAGSHAEAWDGRDAGGAPVATGVYFYRLRSGGSVLERRMVLLE